MELAIPLVVIGGLYVASNQDKSKISKNQRTTINDVSNLKENFENMGANKNYLPNVDLPSRNYPYISKELGPDAIMAYPSGRASTDKYYNQNVYEDQNNKGIRTGRIIKDVYSLTGDVINPKDFKHNNMAPFFGPKIRGSTVDADISETVLDNLQGSGSQYFAKQEIAPLFKPQEMAQFPNGVPNNSDFYQSRMNPSLRMANILPFDQVKVGPGLGQGYSAEGSNGFNSGMECRDAWLPKTVDELRVSNNPKTTFGLANHEGPAGAEVKNRGFIGVVEKNRPDTDYELGASRWFTAVGEETAPRARGIEVLQPVNRPETSVAYFGSSTGESKATYVDSNYEETKRSVLAPNQLNPASAIGNGSATTGDYGVQGFKILPNNRLTSNTNEMGIVGGAIKAAIAPLLDILRPTRKENVVGNINPSGNVSTIANAGVVWNPADRTKTTIREMTEGKLDMNHLNVGNQTDGGAYTVSLQQPITNQRDTTNINYSGNATGGSSNTAVQSYNAAYNNQRINVNKSYESRPNAGGMTMWNGVENIHVNRIDNDRNNNRWFVPSGNPVAAPSTETHGLIQGGKTAIYADAEYNLQRIQPDLLSAFRSNPYSQSLSSWA
jgi:hypothetical protein